MVHVNRCRQFPGGRDREVRRAGIWSSRFRRAESRRRHPPESPPAVKEARQSSRSPQWQRSKSLPSRLERAGSEPLPGVAQHKGEQEDVLEAISTHLALGRPKLQASEERIEALPIGDRPLTKFRDDEPTDRACWFHSLRSSACLTRRDAMESGQRLQLQNPETNGGSRFREHCRALVDLQKHLEENGSPVRSPVEGHNLTSLYSLWT